MTASLVTRGQPSITRVFATELGLIREHAFEQRLAQGRITERSSTQK